MNNLCEEIGWKSINHAGEQLCGDHVDLIEQGENSSVLVLADGLGSGVKASILSTLTAKIISTMMAENVPLDECVKTIAATLPICSERGVAYSTFTVIHLKNHSTAELIQYDNPSVILIRDNEPYSYPTQELNISGKKILRSELSLQENDVLIAMSDGCPHAGIGRSYNFGWRQEEIAAFMKVLTAVGYSAKTLATMLVDECDRLYGGQPGDDATACVVKVRRRAPMNILFGPPRNRDDADRMMALFFSKEGKHIICGGTTSSIAAKYLGKPLRPTLAFEASDVPPIAELEGVESEDAANRLRGVTVYAAREDLPLKAGAFFIADLIGTPVRHADTGESIGMLTDVTTAAPADLYTVTLAGGGQALIPAVPAFVVRTDPDDAIYIRPIPGLLGEEADK